MLCASITCMIRRMARREAGRGMTADRAVRLQHQRLSPMSCRLVGRIDAMAGIG
jgi:hypothetical protein